MAGTTPQGDTSRSEKTLSSVCINGHPVYGKFIEEGQALASALALKRKCRTANVSVLDETSGVHFCVALPRPDGRPSASR